MPHTRRQFLCNCVTTFGATALAMNRFGMINALAQTADYRALVCLFLFGGNDSDNVIIPYDNYSEYAAVRSDALSLQIPKEQLLRIRANGTGGGLEYGLHPSLTGLQSLWQDGKVAAVCNAGPLSRPLTRDEYRNRPDLRPLNLFSHSDQQAQWQTSLADQAIATGWGGRSADKTRALNPASVRFPMMITTSGVTLFTEGIAERPLALSPGSPFRLEGFPTPPDGDPRYEALRQLVQADRQTILVRSAAITMEQAVENARELTNLPTVGTFPNTGLGGQFRQVAQLIKLNRQVPSLQLNRQLFFCSLGGFDTHNAQVNNGNPTAGTHANLWLQVSDAMKAFYDEMVAQSVESSVTTFTLSDFGRTFRPNGSLGTDHAWGSHQLVMGGSVGGGAFYGTFPTLVPNGPDDADSGGGARGRWIPTTSVDQYGATLASWYGVSDVDLQAVFPNLNRFPTTRLGFLGA
jgi:uncharacterized protein (DUF1501 family)